MKSLLMVIFFAISLLAFEKEDTNLSTLLEKIGYQVVQLERSGMGQFIVTIELENGIKIKVIVDTGSSKTLFDSTFMKENGFTLRDANLKLFTGSGEQKVKSTSVKNLKIGNANTGKATVYCTDMSYIQKGFLESGDEKVHALLGADFLTVYSALVDVKNAKLYLKVN